MGLTGSSEESQEAEGPYNHVFLKTSPIPEQAVSYRTGVRAVTFAPDGSAIFYSTYEPDANLYKQPLLQQGKENDEQQEEQEGEHHHHHHHHHHMITHPKKLLTQEREQIFSDDFFDNDVSDLTWANASLNFASSSSSSQQKEQKQKQPFILAIAVGGSLGTGSGQILLLDTKYNRGSDPFADRLQLGVQNLSSRVLWNKSFPAACRCVNFSPRDEFVVAGCFDSSILILSFETGETLCVVPAVHPSYVQGINVSSRLVNNNTLTIRSGGNDMLVQMRVRFSKKVEDEQQEKCEEEQQEGNEKEKEVEEKEAKRRRDRLWKIEPSESSTWSRISLPRWWNIRKVKFKKGLGEIWKEKS